MSQSAATGCATGLRRVRIGYMPLTDCAPVVVAAELGFDRRHGIAIVPVREHSWAGLRDRLLAGGIDLAHALYGLVYGVELGIGGPQRAMAVLMGLGRNGQGITLSRRVAGERALDAEALARRIRDEARTWTFAQTFPTGTHAMWLSYWLAAAGIDPMRDVRQLTVPPPQMVAHLRRGQIDGFSVGAPWNQLALDAGVGVFAASSQQVWPDHPEKVLAATAAYADGQRETCHAAVCAVLEACRWIDASDDNRRRAARFLSRPEVLDVSDSLILPRLLGAYDDGLGRRWTEARPMCFHADGDANYPYASDGLWFMTQYRRFGLIARHPDYAAVSLRVQRAALYAEAAAEVGVPLPTSTMRRSRLCDGRVWDGRDPAAYADSFPIGASNPPALPAAA